MRIELIPAHDLPEELLPLYREYAALLIEVEPIFSRSLERQNYDAELTQLHEKYGLPDGRLYLLRVDGCTAGCVGMRRHDKTSAEIKRLYIRKEYRGHNIAEGMVQRLIDDARSAGYRTLLLDTLPGLRTAVALYRRMGFRERSAYYDCVIPNTIFMEYPL